MSWPDELKLLRLPRHRRMLASRLKMRALHRLPTPLKRILYAGSRYYCSICESRLRRFLPFGHLPDEWCPVCASMRRHRLMWIYLRDRTALLDGDRKRMLHIAPEPALETRLERTPGIDYVTADLNDPHVMDREDITKLTYANERFDVIVCSHVLEHVPDDRAAMNEFARVLSPGGLAVIMVPYYVTGVTDEDLSVVDPQERELRFGQHDHVRYYGTDTVDRLAESGLEVEAIAGAQLLLPEELGRLAVDGGETLFICRKGSTT